MIMVGIRTFIGSEWCIKVVVVSGNFGGKLGFFESIINNLMSVADPTATWFISLSRI